MKTRTFTAKVCAAAAVAALILTGLQASAAIIGDGIASFDVGNQVGSGDITNNPNGLSFTGQMRERERGLLNKIEKTLEAIERGEYGECESCGEPIEAKRLLARPVASLCIDCKDEQERLERKRN